MELQDCMKNALHISEISGFSFISRPPQVGKCRASNTDCRWGLPFGAATGNLSRNRS